MNRSHLFDGPADQDVVRMPTARAVEPGAFLTPAEADARIDAWAAHALAQRTQANGNSGKVVLSLFDRTGVWAQPWVDAGYSVFCFDIQNDPEAQDIDQFSVSYLTEFWGDFGGEVYAVLAACPCTDFANSGARHFAAKDADGRTQDSVRLVRQTLATVEFFKPAIWAIENPAGRIARLTGLPRWRLGFDPWNYGATYTKRSFLWGRFNAELPTAPVEPVDGSKMHQKYGGKSLRTKNARSETPEGFAYAFFMANNAADHPQMALQHKYAEWVEPRAIRAALAAGLGEQAIDDLIADHCYMEGDADGATAALRRAAGEVVWAKTADAEPRAMAPEQMHAAAVGDLFDAVDVSRTGIVGGYYDDAIERAVERWAQQAAVPPELGVRVALRTDTAAFADVGEGTELAQVLAQAAEQVRAGGAGPLHDTNGECVGEIERLEVVDRDHRPARADVEVVIESQAGREAIAQAIERVAAAVASGEVHAMEELDDGTVVGVRQRRSEVLDDEADYLLET